MTRVLLIDEGELDDVASLLARVGAEVTRARADAPIERTARSPALLVTTARHALALAPGAADARVRVAVASEGSRTLRGALRRAGFDFLVRRPVHPEALRLLFARLLYRGPEKRHAARVPIGAPVTFKAGLGRHEATLVDLSQNGCRLLCKRPPRAGRRLTLQLVDPNGTKPWTVGGVVSRRTPPTSATPGAWSVAVAFDALAREPRERIARWLAEHASGPATWQGGPVPGLVRPGDETREQRRGPRRAYTKRVIALAESGARVLLARDLSPGGLRVEAAAGLAPGARIDVALHGSPLPQPLVLRARVIRRGAGGDVVLRFEDVDAGNRERLAKLLADQPEIEALAPARAPARRRLIAHLLRSR